MNPFNRSLKKNKEALEQMDQAIGHYIASLEGLSETVESIEDKYVQKQCAHLLSMAINEVAELQHITSQKKLLLNYTTHSF